MRRFILICVFLAIITLLVWKFYAPLEQVKNPQLSARIAESKTSIVYVLDTKKWTTFPLPANVNSLKIITNADLPAGYVLKPNETIKYAIEYQLIDKNNKLVRQKEFNFVASLKQYSDKRFSEPITASFYLSLAQVPSDPKVAMLNFQGEKNIVAFRVRAKRMHPIIKNIVIRISVNEELPARKLEYLWLRMDPEQKIMSAQGNIYPQELLLEKEIHNLLRIQARPLGPTGTPGKDYHSRILYVSKELEAEIPPLIFPYGVFIDEVIYGVIPIPEGKHLLRLNIGSTGIGKEPKKGSQIQIRWIGRTAQERLNFNLVWRGKDISWEHVIEGGLLEISSSGQLIARAYLLNKKTEEITPLPLYVRTYSSDKNLPIAYKINHVQGKPTLFRINLSFLLPLLGEYVQKPKINYFLLDKKGKVINTGALIINSLHTKLYDLYLLSRNPTESEKQDVIYGKKIFVIKHNKSQYIIGFLKSGNYTEEKLFDKKLIERFNNTTFEGDIERDKDLLNEINKIISSLGGYVPSNYDRVAYESAEHRVSNLDSYFFSLPEEVDTIKFLSDHPVLLDAYNRPYDLIREIKVPEDSYLEDPNRYRQPAWFPLKPINYKKLLSTNRSVLITRQYRPAEEDPELLKGNYQWQDYHPDGKWLGRNLLTTVKNRTDLRQEAVANIYKDVPTNERFVTQLQGIVGEHVIEPNIAYIRHQSKSVPLNIYLADQLLYQGIISTMSGEIRLPPLKIGEHHFMIKCNGCADSIFTINNISPASSDRIKRLLNRFNTKELSFDYEKNSPLEEVLSIRFHAPYGTTTRSIIGVRVDGPTHLFTGPMHSLSFLDRKFDIRPNPNGPISLMGTPDNKVDNGEIFSIPLGEDILPGKYRVHIYLLKGSTGYVSLTRIIPGNFEQRRIFVEPEI